MKKRVLCILLSMALIALCVTCLLACSEDDDSQKLPQLKTPEVTRDGDNAVWKKVENAVKYELDISGETLYVDCETTSYPLKRGQVLKVRAIGDDVNYSSSEWSGGVYTSVELPDDEI